VFLGLAALAAVGDWWAVARGRTRVEYVCKPATLALLVGVAATLEADDNVVRACFLVALVLSLLGDVFLMLPQDLFIAGLASFLAAHLAFIVGLWLDGQTALAFAIGVAVAAAAIAVIGRRILRAVRRGGQPEMAPPVAAYMGVISLMLASAIGTREPLAIAGAGLFYASDAMIAWERFVRPQAWHRLAIIVTYHLAQAGLTLSLLT
jgi:uncharacterized membrane protein YhhN